MASYETFQCKRVADRVNAEVATSGLRCMINNYELKPILGLSSGLLHRLHAILEVLQGCKELGGSEMTRYDVSQITELRPKWAKLSDNSSAFFQPLNLKHSGKTDGSTCYMRAKVKHDPV